MSCRKAVNEGCVGQELFEGAIGIQKKRYRGRGYARTFIPRPSFDQDARLFKVGEKGLQL